MPASTMLMIGHEPALLATIGEGLKSLKPLKLQVLPTINAAMAYDSWDNVVLVVIPIQGKGQTPEVARLLRMISAARRTVPLLVIGEEADPQEAATLLRLGVADYLTRPIDIGWMSYLFETLTIRSRQTSISSEEGMSGEGPPEVEAENPIEGSSDVDPLMVQVRRVAPQKTTILISGESGTGKTRLARLIHDLSPQRHLPFLSINCGDIAPELIESEMFGLVRHTRTGSGVNQAGKFAEAGSGTLFLDEIEKLPMPVQTRLLRALEDGVFEPTNSQLTRPLRARFIAASNRILEDEVDSGQFRSDLYYRLNVIALHLLPLRERREEIPGLISRFFREFSHRQNGAVESFTPEAFHLLQTYEWPGNVRELRTVIERLLVLRAGLEIREEDLPQTVRKSRDLPKRTCVTNPKLLDDPSNERNTLAQIRRDAELARITEALAKHGNNRLRAALELGISRMTLYKKLYKYGLMNARSEATDGVA